MISIIVPIYKAESFITRCIDSILAQTYQDWELLLVDDGSPDDSGKICDEYAAKDARIQVFHKPNGGVSSARNLGLKKAIGDWVSFIDADDYLLPEFFERLIAHEKYDLVMSGSRRFGNSDSALLIPEDREYDTRTFVEHIFKSNPSEINYMCCISYPWGKILRADIIRRNHLVFNTNMKLSEDTCFMLQYLEHVDRVKFIAGGDYMYFVSSGPKTHLRMTAEEYKSHVEGLLTTSAHLGGMYNVDSTKYSTDMCSMYYSAFLNSLKTASYLEVRKQLNTFKEFNTIPYNNLMKNMTPHKQGVLKVAMSNSILLFLTIKLFLK